MGARPGYTPAHGIGAVGLIWPSGASFTCAVRRPSSMLTMGIDDQYVGVSMRSAPQIRHSLANTGQAIRGWAAIMCEACSRMGTLIFGSSAISHLNNPHSAANRTFSASDCAATSL